MASTEGQIRNAAREAEKNAAQAARSAASSARSNAATARAAQSAATGAWVGAGFQAATAFQAARTARAHEERLQLQHAMAEQEKLHQFAMWRQTPDGEAFVKWRTQAVRLAQLVRDRDSIWLQSWASAISRARDEIPAVEVKQFTKYSLRLKQRGLLFTAIVLTAVVSLFLLRLLPTAVDLASRMTAQLLHPEQYLSPGGGYGSIPEEVRLGSALLLLITFLVYAIPIGSAIFVWRLFRRKQRRAREDSTVRDASQERAERWGFDALSVQPGYTAFHWAETPNSSNYADELMNTALTGHTWFPTRSQLIPLKVPASWAPHPNHPDEVNQALAAFQQQRGPLHS